MKDLFLLDEGVQSLSCPSPSPKRGIWSVSSQGCEISLCKDVNISMFTSQLLIFTLSSKSSQSTEEALSCAKYSQHDYFGDRKPESQASSLLWASGSMKLDRGTQGWEGSRSDAREDTAHLQPAGDLLIREGQRGIWGLRTGAEVERFRSTCFCSRPALVPSATAGREAPGLSSCPVHALDFVCPEGPAAAQLHNDIFS